VLRRNRASLPHRVLVSTLLLALLSPIVPAPRPAVAAGYITDAASHPPPTSGAYAYFATYGTFSPSQSGFPAVGGTFVDPVFGSTIRRLSNELNQYSYSENYAKNGFINADATLMHHRAPSGHNIINTTTGQVVRANVPFNMDSSFAPDDPNAFYWFNFGSPTLNKYSVSTGTSTAVKTFTAGLTQLGGSVDWIDGSGRYMVLMLGGAIRVYDVKSDILYAGSIPASYASSGGWVGISPDGNYVITATDPAAFRSFKIDHAAKSVNTSGVLFWTLCGDHADVVSSSNGKTYLVAFECHSEAAIYAVDVTIPQSGANVAKQRADNKRIIKLASWTDTAGHFSGVSKGALKDWFFFTIESGDDTFTAPVTSSWRPYMQELIMANVITGEVRRLAHHRSRSVTTNYFYTPRPSASWDGSLVTWVSNFGHYSNGYADLYAIRIDGAATEPPPPPPPPPSSLSVSFTNPASGATVSGTVTVTTGATGGSGSGYTYTVKAGTATIYNGTNSTFSWNTTATANGSVTLTATVTDSAQGTASASRTVTVSNTTSSPPSPPATTGLTIDNGQAGTSSTGTWCVSSATGFYGTNSLYSCGTGADTYRWTPSMTTAGAYNVYVWWTAHANRSTAVPISVTHAGGTTTKTFNERVGGGQWVLHGQYSFNTGTGGYVQVSGSGGQAAADAVRFVPAGAEIVMDNGQAGTSSTGTWCTSEASNFVGTSSLYSCGSGGDTYQWRPTIPALGTYQVYVWWTSHPNRSTSVPIAVTHSGGTTVKNFNQRVGGGQWVLHGEYTFSQGTAGFVQVSDANGQAAADAVRLVIAP
jgi:hypothetical protein